MDPDLVQKVREFQAGDEDALGVLYEIYLPRVVGYLHNLDQENRYSGTPEGIAQQVFLDLLMKPGKLKKPGSFEGFIYKTARNMFLMARRSEKIWSNVAAHYSDLHPSVLGTANGELVRVETTVPYNNLRVAELEEIIAALPERELRVIQGSIEGLTGAELAERLGYAPGGIYKIRERARDVFREKLRLEDQRGMSSDSDNRNNGLNTYRKRHEKILNLYEPCERNASRIGRRLGLSYTTVLTHLERDGLRTKTGGYSRLNQDELYLILASRSLCDDNEWMASIVLSHAGVTIRKYWSRADREGTDNGNSESPLAYFVEHMDRYVGGESVLSESDPDLHKQLSETGQLERALEMSGRFEQQAARKFQPQQPEFDLHLL